jgi:hypothetical protein
MHKHAERMSHTLAKNGAEIVPLGIFSNSACWSLCRMRHIDHA